MPASVVHVDISAWSRVRSRERVWQAHVTDLYLCYCLQSRLKSLKQEKLALLVVDGFGAALGMRRKGYASIRDVI